MVEDFCQRVSIPVPLCICATKDQNYSSYAYFSRKYTGPRTNEYTQQVPTEEPGDIEQD